MGLNPECILDNSVTARQHQAPVAERIDPLRDDGILAICGITELEALCSARNRSEYEQVRAERLRSYSWAPMSDDQVLRALDIQRRLARTNHHRAVKLPDLLLAANAEAYGLTILHYDRDFERIAEVTGQPVEWVVPPGSVP